MENHQKISARSVRPPYLGGDDARANQLRLWFASMAYVLLCALRRIALQQTQFAKANCSWVRPFSCLIRLTFRPTTADRSTAWSTNCERGT